MKSDNSIQQLSSLYKTLNIHNIFEGLLLVMWPSKKHWNRGFSYLPLPNKEQTNNASVITVKIWLNEIFQNTHIHTYTLRSQAQSSSLKVTFLVYIWQDRFSTTRKWLFSTNSSPYLRTLNSKMVCLLSVYNVKVTMKNKRKQSWSIWAFIPNF